MRLLCLFASALVASSAFAQTPGSCEPGTAQAVLDVSDVQASLFNGALFFGGSTTSGDGYLVPKATGNSAIFAASLWIGGKVDGEIRASHSRFGTRQMWPGPLDEGATLPNPSDCSDYDRIWTVSTFDVAIYEQTGVASSDLADWPVGLGAPAVDASGQPVGVTSREQTIEPANGERPMLSGTQTAFWVMNDVGNEHLNYSQSEYVTDSAPLGIEVAVTAFSIVSEEAALHQGTFYQYTVTNRNTRSITDAYFGFYVDPDLGGAGDDYVGVDTTRGLGFVYNSTPTDVVYATPPALGVDLLDGLAAFPFAPKSSPGPARNTEEVYNQLQGLWPDGTPVTAFGGGYQSEGPPTRFGWPGDPVTGTFWSEVNTDGNGTGWQAQDHRFVVVSPQFSLQPNEAKTFGLAVLFGQGLTHLTSITKLRQASDRVQAAYNDSSLFQTTATTSLLATPEQRQPEPGASFHEGSVAFEWGRSFSSRYRLDISQSSDFTRESTFTTYSTTTYPEVEIPNELVADEPVTLYWRVRAESNTQRSPWSAIRSFSYYRYIGRPLTLADGSPAYVEVSGPDGADPCAEDVTSPDGCDEVFGNLVYRSLNSTGDYYFSEAGGTATGSDRILGTHAPNDFEIRFTDAGGLGHYTFQDGNIIRVPFEIWDVGVVAPGEENDPSDDIRLIPILLADNNGTCAFDASEIPDGEATFGGFVESDRVYAYYPATTYADYETAYAALVDAAEGCHPDPEFTADGFRAGARVIQRQVFGSSSDAPALPKTGTVIRMYTTDPFVVADEATPRAGDLTLGPAYPNPATRSLTVPYRLASSSTVELAVYDVLGRRVAALVNTRQPEGAHTAQLDASTLAPGVYVVRLRAGEEDRTTRITVVR